MIVGLISLSVGKKPRIIGLDNFFLMKKRGLELKRKITSLTRQI